MYVSVIKEQGVFNRQNQLVISVMEVICQSSIVQGLRFSGKKSIVFD